MHGCQIFQGLPKLDTCSRNQGLPTGKRETKKYHSKYQHPSIMWLVCNFMFLLMTCINTVLKFDWPGFASKKMCNGCSFPFM